MTQPKIMSAHSSPVVAETVVNVPQAFAFETFTKQGTWWPMASHHIAKQPAVDVIVEAKSGGRWYEKAADGTECLWGDVLIYDPFGRLVLGWHLNAQWEFDPDFVTEVEVTFTVVGPEETLVKIEHRNLEKYGLGEEAVRNALDSEMGWPGILKQYADRATRE